MAYQIGQVRKNNSTTYMTDLSASQTTLLTVGFGGNNFNDFALRANFSALNTYYLRFKVKRKTNMDITITLGLYQTNTGTYKTGTYQTLQTFIVNRFINGVTDEYATYEIMFNPNDSYSYLAFVLQRNEQDYIGNAKVIDELYWNGDDGDLMVVNNILPHTPCTKIGFQARPGTLIAVNNESIRLGKSGVYEINNGVEITSVGVTAPNGEVEPFILDYAYNG